MKSFERGIKTNILLTVLLVLLVVLNLVFGSVNIPVSRLLRILLGEDEQSSWAYIVWESRIPQILTAAGNKLYYHTWPTPSGKHNYEIDFLLSRKAKICPIEVKSSTSNLHVSIDEFQKKFSARIQQRYLLHSKDIRKEQDLILLPMYMSMFL